jgi:hypothetical protein
MPGWATASVIFSISAKFDTLWCQADQHQVSNLASADVLSLQGTIPDIQNISTDRKIATDRMNFSPLSIDQGNIRRCFFFSYSIWQWIVLFPPPPPLPFFIQLLFPVLSKAPSSHSGGQIGLYTRLSPQVSFLYWFMPWLNGILMVYNGSGQSLAWPSGIYSWLWGRAGSPIYLFVCLRIQTHLFLLLQKFLFTKKYQQPLSAENTR